MERCGSFSGGFQVSELLERLQADSREALKRRDDIALQALRMVLAQAKNARIEKGTELSDTDVAALIQRAIKTRKDSIEQFRRGSREDLAIKEEREVEVLQGFLPRQLSEAETASLVESVIKELGASGKKDLGRVMKALQARSTGALDNRLASRIASEKLG